MAKLQGTILASKIVPTDSQDTYATHEALYGKGGHRSVSSIAERDAIPADRREVGMSVYVAYVDELAGNGKYFLKGGITNSHWELEESNSGINQATLEELDKKVDKEEGKQLSQENFTTAFMQKLSQLDNNFKGYFLTEEQIAETVTEPATGNYVLVKRDSSSAVFFFDNNSWVDTGSSSLGDMMAVIYDPSGIAGDVFDVDNMVESLTRKFMTAVEREKLSTIEEGAQVNTITSVNGKTGEVTLNKSDIGLNNVDNTPDNTKKVAEAAKTTYKLKIGNVEFDGSQPIEVEIPDALPEILESDVGKVLTVNEEGETEWKTPTGGGGSGGSGLSVEDKTKLNGIEEQATKNKTDEFLLSRSNHTGLQSMDTISGLAVSLLGKADINTVYAEPMSTNYTTRNEVLEASKTIKYPLNGINNNYALHAFALKELPIGKEVLSLNTVLMGSGYYGVKIPRISNTQLSFPSGNPEPLKRMTAHNQHGQTVSATTEYNAGYTAWKIFAAGDAPTAVEDCWASSRAPTVSDPQTITFTSPNVFTMSKYKIRSRSSSVASIKTWKIEGIVGSSGNWELIHEVVNDTRNTPSLDRVFDIPKENRKACDQHRLVIFDRNGAEPYTTVARLVIYQEPSKFMIEDGVNKYRSTSTGYSLSYTPMTKYSEHNQVVSATSEYNATFAAWKVLLAGDAAKDTTDCWVSIAAPTALAPQTITIDLGQPKKISSYSIVNRFGNITEAASPNSWSIEVRNNLLDDWISIDNIQGDKDSNPLSVRNFSIAEEKRGEWRYFRIVIKDRNGASPYTCISRLRIYGDLVGEELELVPNVITKNDITVNGTSNSVIITKQKLSTLSDPYIITDKPSSVELTMDSEKEYEYSNNVKIALANTYIKFTTTESGKYKFCYQEPAPDIP